MIERTNIIIEIGLEKEEIAFSGNRIFVPLMYALIEMATNP